MSGKRAKASSIIPALILCLAVALWIHEISGQEDTQTVSTETRNNFEKAADPDRIGTYEFYQGCTIASDRGNDGDSFRVLFPDGKKEIVRLYFVDAPEGGFRTYRGGENNHHRISQQAEDMGGISPAQAVEIGIEAKSFTLTLLEKSHFSVFTKWDSPFKDRRYHAFVEVSTAGGKRFLHELLVERGLARIHTKGAPLPDGTTIRKHEGNLRSLEKDAKANKAGAWGL